MLIFPQAQMMHIPALTLANRDIMHKVGLHFCGVVSLLNSDRKTDGPIQSAAASFPGFPNHFVKIKTHSTGTFT